MCSPRFADAAEQLEGLWQQGQLPDVHDFLARAGELSPAEIVAVLRIDQRHRWQRGERVEAEAYLRAWPLVAEDDRALELICCEFRLRQALGEAASLEEYLQRFPAYAARLQQQIELHWGLASEALVSPGKTMAASTASLPADSPGLAAGPYPTIPDYELLGVLGRGAMGVVYRARQIGLDRLVALKLILGGAHANPAALARFRQEAQTLARLQHPNIIQVYVVGQHDGHLFYALEYAEGGDLARMLAGTSHPPRQSAQLIKLLALAMHCVHQHGIVHRDLKPANVLLTAEGIPKISDFGLARQPDVAARQTQTGDVVGTPSYMAPEQAGGRMNEVGPATDVYALGAILYEMLTGRPPFVAKNWLDALQQIRHSSPVPPSRLQQRVPRDLDTICLKCLEKEPGQRYASAAALANDLEAFLAGEPIEGRLASRWTQAVRWVRRRPTAAAMLGSAVAAMFGLLLGALWYSPLAMGGATVLSLLIGVWWYNARLQSALYELDQQQVHAQRSVERVHLLLETTQRLMSVSDLDALLRLLTETTTRMANAQRATIFLLDPLRGELWSKVALGEDVRTIRVPLGVGIAGSVAATGETINVSDAYADERFNPDIDRASGYRTRNLLAFPMKAQDGRILGVLEVLNKRVGCFEADDVWLLGALASSAAAALENARLSPADSPKESRREG